jgi:hypothetical protein
MLLLAIDSLLFFFFTYSLGYFFVEGITKVFGRDLKTGILEYLLLGMMVSFVYFNLVSFFLPANYLTLIPLALVAICFLLKKRAILLNDIKKQLLFFSTRYWPIALLLLALLFIFWMVPPINGDSAEYHYLSIKWYEDYKVIPGLANIHGRFAFNPAAFIVSAAYSFSDIAHQALYPVNGVLFFAFSFWWLKKIISNLNNLSSLVHLFVFSFVLRQMLADISSPSSDMLAAITTIYIIVRLTEDSMGLFSKDVLVILLSLISLACKLSVAPVLITVFFYNISFLKVLSWQKWSILLCLGLILYLPWLARNFIMSGYLIYPIQITGFIKPDWQAPKEILALDYTFIHDGPRFYFDGDYTQLRSLSYFQFLKYWISSHFTLSVGRPINFTVFCLSILSPLYWLCGFLAKKKIKKKVFFLWCFVYADLLCWWFTSPEYRFGISFQSMSFFIPLIYFSYKTAINKKIAMLLVVLPLTMLDIYYITLSIKNYHLKLNSSWILPQKDFRYFHRNDIASFPYKIINGEQKIYYADKQHECINCTGPCLTWNYGEVEMRGKNIEDGFRLKKNEVRDHYPFIIDP